jgi:hypothetical protein
MDYREPKQLHCTSGLLAIKHWEEPQLQQCSTTAALSSEAEIQPPTTLPSVLPGPSLPTGGILPRVEACMVSHDLGRLEGTRSSLQ